MLQPVFVIIFVQQELYHFLDINSQICHLFYHICPILSYILGKNVLYFSYIWEKMSYNPIFLSRPIT